MIRKLKSFLLDDTFFIAVLIIFITITAFGLGRLSLSQVSSQEAGVLIMQNEPVQDTSTPVSEIKVVTSRSGTKYHLLSCPGASQIKEENKVFFDTIEMAKAAGYAPAANCKFE